MRILIAEDNQEIAHLIQMFLEKEGYEVVWKADGQQALDYLLSEEAALCIFLRYHDAAYGRLHFDPEGAQIFQCADLGTDSQKYRAG